MNFKSLAARVISCCLILSAFLAITSLGISALEISSGDKAYINFNHYCVEGKPSYVDEPTGLYYLYRKFNGNNTYLRMMFLSDSSSGLPKTDNNGNPIWAYCIEFGQEVNTGLIRTASTPSASDYFSSLPKEQQRGITLATLYGCPNDTLGVATADAYAATQAVIWEYQTGIRTSTSEDKRQSVSYNGVTLEANRFYAMMKNVNGSTKQGLYAYNTLINKIISHSKTPDLGTNKASLKFDVSTKKYTCTLTDSNNLLTSFNIIPKDSRIKVQVNGNKLILSSDTEIPDTTLTFERKVNNISSQSMLVLKAGSPGQVTVVGHGAVPTTSSLNVSVEKLVIPTYSLSVYKKGEVLTGFETDENGINVPKYEEKYLDGCVINLYAAEDITTIDGKTHFKKDELVKTITTSKDESSVISGLYKGKYYLIEYSAPHGFIKNEQIIPISIGDSKNLDITLANERIKMQLEFFKKFEVENEKDYGSVKFGVYTKNNILDLPENSLVDIITPDENGLCKLNFELPIGYEYYIKELSTKDDFILDENKYTFSFVDFENNAVVGLTETDEIVNRLKPKSEPPIEITEETPLAPASPKPVPKTTTEVSTPQKSTPPKTGDNNNIALFISLTALSFGGINIIKRTAKA